jgi:hypothetical protein
MAINSLDKILYEHRLFGRQRFMAQIERSTTLPGQRAIGPAAAVIHTNRVRAWFRRGYAQFQGPFSLDRLSSTGRRSRVLASMIACDIG